MKNNLRGKIREFIASEEGRVGVKGPLMLGVATGGFFLAQAIIGPTPAMACDNNADCGQHGQCVIKCRPRSIGGFSCWGECV